MQELNLFRISQHVALTTCGECDQLVPQNFAYTGKYNTGQEHFCSVACQDQFETRLNIEVLHNLRRLGL